jgi:hypothetical protein
MDSRQATTLAIGTGLIIGGGAVLAPAICIGGLNFHGLERGDCRYLLFYILNPKILF